MPHRDSRISASTRSRPATLIIPFSIALLLVGVVDMSAADMDGVMMSAGKMMVIRAGRKEVALSREMILPDGTKVEPDGVLLLRDGSRSRLQNGQMIMMDGHVMKGGKPAAMCH